MTTPILWIHGDCLSPHNPAFAAHPDAPALFVWDEALLDQWKITLKRIVFIYECLLELPVTIRRGDVAAELRQFAGHHAAAQVVTVASPSPRFRQIVDTLKPDLAVTILKPEPFVDVVVADLGRFSRYWRVVEGSVYD